MAMGTSGVAGSSPEFSGANRMLDLVRNADLYQQRIADLEAATNAATEAKKEARRIIANAKKKAEDDAKAVIQAAEEQAQDRLGAIQDLETRLADNRRQWEAEKLEEQSKLRSDRAKAAASTKASNDAKKKAEEERERFEAARLSCEAREKEIAGKWASVKEIMGA